jgi:autoinducer 2-degrading protein
MIDAGPNESDRRGGHMFSIWVTMTINTDHEDEFLASITRDAEGSVADEPGCIGFDVIALDRKAGQWAFYERYRDREAFAVGHQSMPHFHQWAEVEPRVVIPGTQKLVEVETVVDQHV